MRFFKRREKQLTGTAEVVAALNRGAYNPLPQLGTAARQRIVEVFQTAKTANYSWMYSHSPAARTVIETIVRNVGQLELRLYEELSDAERQPRPDHPAALSMRYPSETVPADQFIRTLFRDFLIADDAVAIMGQSAAQRLVFKWVPINLVVFLGNSMFDVDTYRIYNKLNGAYTEFPAEQILHWRGENPDDPRIGLSHLETLRDLIAEDAAMQQANVELANSGMSQQMWVYRPADAPEWSNPARQGFEEDLRNRIRRSGDYPVVLEEGMELRPMGISPKDAEALDLRKWIKGEVADEYGVPRGMVGLSDNVEQARSQFYSDTLPPYCEAFTKMLNLRLLVREYGWTDGCFEFNLDEKQMGDERIKTLVSASGRAVFATNEARARLNLPPIDGGDELVTPLNVVVGDNPKPSPQVMGPQDPNAPPQDGSGRSSDQMPNGQPPKALAKAATDLHPSRRAEMDRQRRNVDLAQATVERHLARIGRQLNGAKAKARKASETDWQRWDREFSDDIERLVSQIVETEGTIYAFKFAGDFDMNRVRHYLREMASGAAEGINASIRDQIDTLGLDETLARRPQHVASAGTSLGVKATTWARQEAARQSPQAERRVKTWVADTDRHAEFDGDTVALDADWPAGFAPGGAPNCACTAVIT